MTDPLDDAASVNDRVDNDEHMEEEPQLFPAGALEGDAITPQSLVKKNLPVQVTVSLSRAEVPSRSGLLDPNRGGRVLVSYVPGKVEEVPERADDSSDRVTGWKLRQHLRATFVADANDEAQVAHQAFGALLATDEQAATALLAGLQQMTREQLGQPVA